MLDASDASIMDWEAAPRFHHRWSQGSKWGFPKIRGYLFGGPYNKDYSILGSILGYPSFGKLPSSSNGRSKNSNNRNIDNSSHLCKARIL